ncbi:hypothetical protein BKA66DRAFT_440340 [Pyrenochaeta sp. MPI-SDFR-AT-0127]|nr:hypothetical protein BKA66DRAFT_440340 [Pyrenochaeta sp. MPI-SDFR-AT-0127]
MQVVILLALFAILTTIFSESVDSPLDVFLRGLPQTNGSFSQLHSGSTQSEKGFSGPHTGWFEDKPPQPANEELWCKSVAKGTMLLNAMSYSDADAGQLFMPPRDSARSYWELDDLEEWAYNVYVEPDPAWCRWDKGGHWGVANFFRSRGISDKCREHGGLWELSLIYHGEGYRANDPSKVELVNQKYTAPDGVQRRPTGARFHMAVNGAQGGIIALSRNGPKENGARLKPPVPADQMPILQSSSDIMWGLWQHDVDREDLDNIHFFMALSIVNEATLKVLKRAFNQRNSDLNKVGLIFDMTTEEGKAILGTPNAIGFAYFLIQHKAELGNKIIDGAHVMECETDHKSPCIFFGIKSYLEPRKPPSNPSRILQPSPAVGDMINNFTALVEQHNFMRVHTISVEATSILAV